MDVPNAVSNAQHKFREIKILMDRLERGQRMLQHEIENGSVSKCIEIIQLFSQLGKEMLTKAEELILIEQFNLLGTPGFIRKNGQMVDASYLTKEEVLPITPHNLLMLEKLKDVFGEVPHDILEIGS